MELEGRKALLTGGGRGIGNAVVFLCSDGARYVTNVILPVSGDRFAL